MTVGSDSEPRHLVGQEHGVQVLVTLWPDGSATLATRLHTSDSWSPPIKLEEATE